MGSHNWFMYPEADDYITREKIREYNVDVMTDNGYSLKEISESEVSKYNNGSYAIFS